MCRICRKKSVQKSIIILKHSHTWVFFILSKIKEVIILNGIEKWILAVAGLIGGLWSLVVDGLGLAVATLAVFMAIDYVSGLAQAFYNRQLSSEVGFRGLVKKVYFLLLVGACYMFENLVFGTRHLADGVAISFVAMEFISIAENGVRMNAPFSGVFEAFLSIVKKTADGEEKREDEVQ